MSEVGNDIESNSRNLQKQPVASFINIVLLGLAIKLGGGVAAWHNGFVAGVWGYFFASLVIATGCFCLNCSVAELVSIIAFPGGHYGYVRSSLGPFWGYICGCMGLMESIFFLAVTMLKFGQAFTTAFELNRAFEYGWWVLGYGCMVLFHIRGGLTFWRFMSICSILSILTFGIYLLGSIPFMNFEKYAYANSSTGFRSGLEWFLSLRLPGWFFIGIDLIGLTSEEVVDAKRNIPRAMVTVMCIMFITCLWVQITVAGQSPGLTDSFFGLENIFPLGHGFGKIFAMPHHYGVAFSIVPIFAACTGLLYVAGRQLNAMARSGLLPKYLVEVTGVNRTPVNGMLTASLLGLMGLVVAWFYDPYTLLFRLAIEGGCISYILVLASYISYKTKFSSLSRSFVSPLGIPGAIVGIVIFTVVEIATLFVLPLLADWRATTAFFVYLIIIVIYYWAIVNKRQGFSELEQINFMKAYVVNANRRQQKKIKRQISKVQLIRKVHVGREDDVDSDVSCIDDNTDVSYANTASRYTAACTTSEDDANIHDTALNNCPEEKKVTVLHELNELSDDEAGKNST